MGVISSLFGMSLRSASEGSSLVDLHVFECPRVWVLALQVGVRSVKPKSVGMLTLVGAYKERVWVKMSGKGGVLVGGFGPSVVWFVACVGWVLGYDAVDGIRRFS